MCGKYLVSLIGKSRIWCSLIHQRLPELATVLGSSSCIHAPYFWFQNIGAAAHNATRQISLLCLPASSAGLVALVFCFFFSRHPAELIGRIRGTRRSRSGWCGTGGSSFNLTPAHTHSKASQLTRLHSGCPFKAMDNELTIWPQYEVAVLSRYYLLMQNITLPKLSFSCASLRSGRREWHID